MTQQYTNATSLRSQLENLVKEFQKFSCVSEAEELSSEMKSFAQRIADTSFRVTVVGIVSAGKSTLINAILGKNILVHGTRETTSAITELINTPPTDPHSGKCVLHLQDGTKRELPQMSDLPKYTAIKYGEDAEPIASEYTVTDIATVSLYPYFVKDAKCPLILEDTPGLNGTAKYHREKTMEQVKTAHACVYLIPLRGLAQFDIDFIKSLCDYQKDFIFVQNFADRLNKNEGDSPEKHMAEQEQILKEQVFAGRKDIQYSIVAVSAFDALMAKDPSTDNFRETFGRERTEKEREELYKQSNMEALLAELQRLIQSKRKLVSTAQTMYTRLKEQYDALEDLSRKSNIAAQGVDDTEREEMLSDLSDAEQRMQRILANFWDNEIRDIQSQTRHRIEEEIEKCKEKIHQQIDTEFTEVGDFSNKNLLDTLLQRNLQNIPNKQIETSINSSLNNAFRVALLRLNSQRWTNVTVKFSAFSMPKMENFTPPPTVEIENAKKVLAQAQQEVARTIIERNECLIQWKEAQANYQNTEGSISSNEGNYRYRKNQLGSEPEVHPETAYDTVKRGGLAGLFGLKKTISYERDNPQDIAARNAWREQTVNLENNYRQRKAELEAQLVAAQSTIDSLEKDCKLAEKNLERARESRDIAERSFQSTEQRIKFAREKYTREYVQKHQNILRNATDAYMDMVCETLKEAFRGMIEQNKTKGSTELSTYCGREYADRREELLKEMTQQNDKLPKWYTELPQMKKNLDRLQQILKAEEKAV